MANIKNTTAVHTKFVNREMRKYHGSVLQGDLTSQPSPRRTYNSTTNSSTPTPRDRTPSSPTMPGNAPNKKTRQGTSGRPKWVPFPGIWRRNGPGWYQIIAPEDYPYEPSHDDEDEVQGLRSPQDLISEDRTQLPSYPGVDSEDGEESEDDDFALVRAADDEQSVEEDTDNEFEDVGGWGQQLGYGGLCEGDFDGWLDESDSDNEGVANNEVYVCPEDDLDYLASLPCPYKLKKAECDLLAAEDEALYDESKVPQPRGRPPHEWWKRITYHNKKGKSVGVSRRLSTENMLISSGDDKQQQEQQQQRSRGIASGVLNPGVFRAPPPGESECHAN